MKAILLFFLAISPLMAQSIPKQLFPSNNIWNTAIDTAPIHQNSAIYVQTIGSAANLHPDFGSGLWNNAPIGIPYCFVGAGQAKLNVSFLYIDESDAGGYPIPNNPPIEGGDSSTGDRHILIVDTASSMLYELYSSYYSNGAWTAQSGAIFDLKSNALRPDSWTSADAAGLPILPGLVRYDEILKGEINHAIRFTVPKTQRAYLWPAKHYASSITDVSYPPMGLRMRLKANFDISSYSATSQIILRALKKYGMILADNGSAWFISGVPDERWNNDELNELKKVKGANFEAIDESGYMLNSYSGEVKSSTNSVVENSNDASFVKIQNKADNEVEIIFNNIAEKDRIIEIYNLNGALIEKISNNLEKINYRFQSSGFYYIIWKEGSQVNFNKILAY